MTGTVILVGLILFWVAALLIYARRTPLIQVAPYRQVTQRHMDPDGSEVVTLECGHDLKLTHHRRASFPCLDCIERKP